MKPKLPTGYQRMRATQLAHATELGREVVSDEFSALHINDRLRSLKARRKVGSRLSAAAR